MSFKSGQSVRARRLLHRRREFDLHARSLRRLARGRQRARAARPQLLPPPVPHRNLQMYNILTVQSLALSFSEYPTFARSRQSPQFAHQFIIFRIIFTSVRSSLGLEANIRFLHSTLLVLVQLM